MRGCVQERGEGKRTKKEEKERRGNRGVEKREARRGREKREPPICGYNGNYYF